MTFLVDSVGHRQPSNLEEQGELYESFQRTPHEPRNENILSSVVLGGEFISLAKRNILRIPQIASGTSRNGEAQDRAIPLTETGAP